MPKQMRKDGIITGDDVEWLTRDVEVQKYYKNSKMCGQPFTIQANYDMAQWLSFINNKKNIAAGNKEMPIYIISGANDAVSNYGEHVTKLYNIMNELGYKNVEMKLYEDCRHEILNELNKEEVYNDVLNFFK